LTRVEDTDKGRRVRWNVTGLLQEWQQGKSANQGFFLRAVGDGGTILFCSREHSVADQRPTLRVIGQVDSVVLQADADTFLTKSTYRSQGHTDTLQVSGRPEHSLLRFSLDRLQQVGQIKEAILQLYTTKQYGSADIGVFGCRQGHEEPESEPVLGLAAEHVRDKAIGSDSEVIFFADFESSDWDDAWTYAGIPEVIDTIETDPDRRFQSWQGKALRVRIAKGSTGALNTLYKFAKETGSEPEEIYFRYYLRLADDWCQTLQGGKMPGISGTYGTAGWGGRKSDGTDGWSARGSFLLSIPEDNPLGGLHPIGTYCYHADMKGTYGDSWVWQKGYRGYLEKNRWYCVEQYLRLNTVNERSQQGNQDGVLRAWIDGQLAFEKEDIRFRHTPRLKIEQVWMNVYHGGKKASPYDQHLFIDNVVIARQYIGPMLMQ
jgi:hypothetical protein